MPFVRRAIFVSLAVLVSLTIGLSSCKSGKGAGADTKKVSGDEAAAKAKSMLKKGPMGGQ